MRWSVIACGLVAGSIAASSASAYTLLSPARRWLTAPRLVTVDSRGVPSVTTPDPDHGVTAAVGAVGAWQSGGVNPVYGQSGAVVYRLGDGRSDLIFDDPLDICSGNCIAATTIGYYTGGQSMSCAGTTLLAITDSDVCFNLDFAFNTVAEGSCSSEIYLEAVVTHEVGHLIGLAHSSVASALMYPSVAYCNNKPLAADDLAGRNALYQCGAGGAVPDLVLTALTAPGTGGAGLAMTVGDTTTNQGAGAAAASITRFYLSADLVVDSGDAVLGNRAVPALAAGGSNGGSIQVTVPAGTATGSWYLLARADANLAVAEGDEGNNQRSATVRIGPDLTVSALSAPDRVSRGHSMSVGDTTSNPGGGVAGASSTVFYLSTNATLDAADRRLGARAVPSLAPGASGNGSVSVTVPSSTPRGTYYVIAAADGNAAVSETSESNNTRSRIISVR